MRPTLSLRTALALALGGVTLALGGAILATTFLGSQRAVRTLSSSLVDGAARRATIELDSFLGPVQQQLRFSREWVRTGLLTSGDAAAMLRLMVPVLEENPQLASAVVADELGNELRLLREAENWRLLQRSADEPGEEQWWEWSRTNATAAGASAFSESSGLQSEALETADMVQRRQLPGPDAQGREWFEGALAGLDERVASAGDVETGGNEVAQRSRFRSRTIGFSTGAYRLVGTDRLGATQSLATLGADGRAVVVAFDILFEQIRAFVEDLSVSENGSVVILVGDEGRVLALQQRVLPAGATTRDWLFRVPSEIDSPLLQAASAAYASGPPALGAPRRFQSSGGTWWGQVRPYVLPSDVLLIVVLVPEGDLLAERSEIRRRVTLVTGAAFLLALAAALGLSRSFSRPIETLVRNADRIRVGELDKAEPVVTSLREIQDLASAGQRMRSGLATLMKVEGDLQLARQIQRSTLPSVLPQVAGWSVAAASEPADETGGDTFDVIGFDADGRLTPPGIPCDRAALLLADATGHGVAAALSVSQLRGMVRGALRGGAPLGSVTAHLNEQLVVDLPHNRFITAWLALIDAESNVLRYISAGQGPLLHYRRATGNIRRLNASSPPLGMFAGLEFATAPRLHMEAGDLFVVLTDGTFEASSPQDEEFATERVEELIVANARRSAEEIRATIEAAVEQFTAGSPADDDRTAVIVQRNG